MTNFLVKVRVLGVGMPSPGGITTAVAQPEVVIPGGDVQLRPGMSGTVDVFTQTAQSVIAVPIGAVTARDFNKVRRDTTEGGVTASGEDLRKVVFVVEGGKARMFEVSTGIADATHIHIRSGVSDTARVVTGPFSALSRTLRPDMNVVVKERSRFDSDEG